MVNAAVIPYHRFSKSAKALAKGLGVSRAPIGTKWPHINEGKTAICWGINQKFKLQDGHFRNVLNPPDVCSKAVDKTTFFRAVDGVARVPEWTTDPKTAIAWGKDGTTVIGRQTTHGSGGKGIVFLGDVDVATFVSCHLFTKYIKNIAEYRVHIAFGKVIDVQKKGLRKDVDKETVDTRIRNHSNGYVFMRQDIEIPEDVKAQALLAHKAIGLDFGAYDVVWNKSMAKAFVLEANTAPGLEGQTVDSYVKAFKENL